jgi:hypothetical protein
MNKKFLLIIFVVSFSVNFVHTSTSDSLLAPSEVGYEGISSADLLEQEPNCFKGEDWDGSMAVVASEKNLVIVDAKHLPSDTAILYLDLNTIRFAPELQTLASLTVLVLADNKLMSCKGLHSLWALD